MWNFTSKDKVNSRTAKTLDSAKGEQLTLIGFSIYDRVDVSTGEKVRVASLKTTNGMYTTISRTAIECLEDIEDYVTDEDLDEVDIVVQSQVSKNGRNFLTITLAD